MKKRSSKELLAEALLSLSETMPIDKITVKQLVMESGVSLQTFYNHFSDKSDLILWIHKSVYEDLFNRMNNGELTRKQLLTEYVRYYMEHKEFMVNAFHSTLGQDPFARNIANHTYELYLDFLTKKYQVKSLPQDILFMLRLYCYAGTLAIEKYAEYFPHLPQSMAVEYLYESMPWKLKEYIEG